MPLADAPDLATIVDPASVADQSQAPEPGAAAGAPAAQDPGDPGAPGVPGAPGGQGTPARGRRGGRRPGAGRKARAPETDDAGPSTAKPAEPFAGPVVDGGAGTVNPDGLVAGIMADPDTAATIFVVALDGAVQAVARMRYGPDTTLKTKDRAQDEIKAAVRLYMRAASIQLTPGQAVGAAILAAYLEPILDAEGERAKRLRAQAAG